MTGPLLLHVHDWHAALALVYLRTWYATRPGYSGVTYAEEMPPWGDAGELPAWTLSRFGTTFHPSSTCRMGPASDAMTVVDHNALVHKVDGLRIVDASIFPTGPRANIHFAVVAVAEKLADAVKQQYASA